MAGRRQTGPGQPKSYEARQAARRRRMAHKLAEADTPSRQIGAVADHLRAAIQYVPPATAARIAQQVIGEIRRAIALVEQEEARR